MPRFNTIIKIKKGAFKMPVVGKVDGTYVKRYKNVGGPGVLLMFGGYRLFKGGSVPITQETYDK